MKKLNLYFVVTLALLVLSVSACKEEEKEDNSLYARLGKVEAISAVVDQFLTNVVADERINEFFAETVQNPEAVNNLRQNLIDQICEATGGPCVYKGLSMIEAHTGMNISDADFNAMVEDLIAALNQFNVPTQEKDELISALGALKPEIVGL